jgi:hypothetical protein
MFEPENEIERMLMRAAQEPSERSAFAEALIDAEIIVALVPEGGRIAPGPDGKTTVPEGTRLSLPSVMRGEQRLLPFFTAPSRARAWFKGDHVATPDRTRDLFGRYPEAFFVLNPGSDYGKEFTPAEVKRLLAGHFEEGAETITLPVGEELLLGHPSDVPDELIAALSREFSAEKSIRGAWLMLAARAGHPDQTWMLGVDHAGSWSNVLAAINRAVAGQVLKGRPLDAVPLESSSLASTLRTGIPIPAVKRGFFQKLFS